MVLTICSIHFIVLWELIMVVTSVASLGTNHCYSDVPRYIGLVYLVAIVIVYC